MVPAGQNTWTYSTAPALGPHSLTVRVADAAGNGTPSSARALTLVTSSPTTTVAIDRPVEGVGTIQDSVFRVG